MTPHDKAIELTVKFYSISDTVREAIKCALIAVEEIKKAHPIIPLTYMLESEAIDAAIEYWNEVKSEIEKL